MCKYRQDRNAYGCQTNTHVVSLSWDFLWSVGSCQLRFERFSFLEDIDRRN